MNTPRPFFGFAALLLLAGLVLSGCSTKRPMPVEAPYDSTYAFEDYIKSRRSADRSSMTPEERFAYDYRTAAMSRMRDEGVPLSSLHLIERAKTAIGTPYVTGGTGMDGFDCSGFVQWAYRDVGIRLPRTAREQSSAGRPVRSGSLMEGDIVAFSHPKRGYHTGIYIGEGKFIHSPGRGKSVSVAALSDPYFSSTFIGARRVSAPESDAEAVRKLMALDERKTRRHPADVRGIKRSATRKQTAANARGPEARKHAGTNAAKAAPEAGRNRANAAKAAPAKAAKRTVAVAQAAPGKAAASGKARNAPQTSAKADPKTGKASAATAKKGGNAQAAPAKNAPAKGSAAKQAPAKTPVKQSAAKAKGSDKGQVKAAPGDAKRKPAPRKADATRKAIPEKASAQTARTAPAKAAPAKTAPQTASKAAPKAPAKTNAQPAKTRASKTEKAAPSKPASAKAGQAAPAKAAKGDPKAGKASAAPAKKGGNAQAAPAKNAPAKGSAAKQAPAKTSAKQPAAKAAASKAQPARQAKK